jgi:hypothetical protein
VLLELLVLSSFEDGHENQLLPLPWLPALLLLLLLLLSSDLVSSENQLLPLPWLPALLVVVVVVLLLLSSDLLSPEISSESQLFSLVLLLSEL